MHLEEEEIFFLILILKIEYIVPYMKDQVLAWIMWLAWLGWLASDVCVQAAW